MATITAQFGDLTPMCLAPHARLAFGILSFGTPLTPCLKAPLVGATLLERMIKLHYNWKYVFLRPSMAQIIARYKVKFGGDAATATAPPSPDSDSVMVMVVLCLSLSDHSVS